MNGRNEAQERRHGEFEGIRQMCKLRWDQGAGRQGPEVRTQRESSLSISPFPTLNAIEAMLVKGAGWVFLLGQ